MRRVKVVSRITLEFNSDELEEIRDLLLVITGRRRAIDESDVIQADKWVEILNTCNITVLKDENK